MRCRDYWEFWCTDLFLVDGAWEGMFQGNDFVLPRCMGAELIPFSDVLRTYSKPVGGPDEVALAMRDDGGCG